MSAACARPIAFETIVAYWASDLSIQEAEAFEAHAMACAECTAASERVAAVTEAFRNLIPPLIDARELETLRASGLQIEENRMVPGERKEVRFRAGLDMLIHRLGGLDLSRAERVRVVVRVESTREVLLENPRAPFDRASGEVLVACQAHFAAFPPDVLIEVEAIEPDGSSSRASYPIPHHFESEATR